MVASDQGYSFWVPHFESKQQQKGFYRVVASVDEVAHKEVVGIRAVAADFEQLLQIVKLAVDVSADLNKHHQ